MKYRGFPHEDLIGYQKALELIRLLRPAAVAWPRRHAVTDQLLRAMQSILVNMAPAGSILQGKFDTIHLDYAYASSLESAACLDIALAKTLTDDVLASRSKKLLAETCRVVVGLRKYREPELQSAAADYGGERQPSFLHETLDAYQQAIKFVRWQTRLPGINDLSKTEHRLVDSPATSIILNIAEGNGRFSNQDHLRFLTIAKTSIVKAAAGLDLWTAADVISESNGIAGKGILRRTQALVTGPGEHLRQKAADRDGGYASR